MLRRMSEPSVATNMMTVIWLRPLLAISYRVSGSPGLQGVTSTAVSPVCNVPDGQVDDVAASTKQEPALNRAERDRDREIEREGASADTTRQKDPQTDR